MTTSDHKIRKLWDAREEPSQERIDELRELWRKTHETLGPIHLDLLREELERQRQSAPGGARAVEYGCLCPVEENCAGAGKVLIHDEMQFIVEPNCPFHGHVVGFQWFGLAGVQSAVATDGTLSGGWDDMPDRKWPKPVALAWNEILDRKKRSTP